MSQLLVNSEHFTSLPVASVSNLDTAPKERAAPTARRFAIWPMVMIGIGGVATLAWNGFLLWHTARAVIGWVGGEI